MNEPVFYEGGGYKVTDRLLTTPRKSYALAKVEYVSVTRPLLVFAAAPAAGVMGMALAFHRYLYWVEIAPVVGVAALVIAAASQIGTLRIHSLALRDDDVSQNYGPVVRLRDVRRAVEKAIVFQTGGEDA